MFKCFAALIFLVFVRIILWFQVKCFIILLLAYLDASECKSVKLLYEHTQPCYYIYFIVRCSEGGRLQSWRAAISLYLTLQITLNSSARKEKKQIASALQDTRLMDVSCIETNFDHMKK